MILNEHIKESITLHYFSYFRNVMQTPYQTYHPSSCPHTSGVRLGPHGSFATEPCRPTACTGITAEPAPNVHYSLFIVHCWFYTFSAKEKDVETGLSYFGSRYYSSDLSIWLSVDPMSDKYASLSPYVYCADNPVKWVDPNGEEIGDYFSLSGKYLGTDGLNDDKVYFVNNKSDKRRIKHNNQAGKTTDVSTVSVYISTTKCEVWASEDVYNRTEKNGGFCEEATSVFPDGSIENYKSGPDARYTIDNNGHVDLPEGYERDGSGTLIHSHPLYEYEFSDGYNHCWPVSSKLDSDDLKEAQKNTGFIVVGRSTPDALNHRTSRAYFFKSGAFIGSVSMRAIRKVNNYYEGL